MNNIFSKVWGGGGGTNVLWLKFGWGAQNRSAPVVPPHICNHNIYNLYITQCCPCPAE